MAKFEVTMEIEAHDKNDALSMVYRALYMGEFDAEGIRVRPAKRRGEIVPEVDPKVAMRLLGDDRPKRPNVDKMFPRLRNEEPDSNPDVSDTFSPLN